MSDSTSKGRLAHWFRQWRMPLRKFLTGKGAIPASDLDDVAQEVFLRLMRYERIELIEHPQAYLFKMAANVAAEWAIRSRYARPHESKWLEGLATEEQPPDDVNQNELQDEVARALFSLPSRQRELLKLQFVDDMSRKQMAQRLGVTERIVKRDLSRAYAALRVRLNTELLDGDGNGRG